MTIPELRRELLALSPEDRRDLMCEMLWSLPRDEMLHIYARISDRMQKDIVGLLPPEISTRILSLLSADDLLRCKAVSREWAKLCDDQSIWKILCQRHTPQIVPRHTTWNDLELHRQLVQRAVSPNTSRAYGDESFEYADDDDSHIMSMSPSPGAVRRTVWERSSGLPTYQRAVAFSAPAAPPQAENSPDVVIPSHLGLPTVFPRVSYKHLYLVRRTLNRRMTYLRPADLEANGRRTASSWNPRVTIINPTSSQEHGGLPGHTESIYSLHLIKHHMNISCRIGEVDDALYSLLAPVSSDIFGTTVSSSRSGLSGSPARASTPSSFSISGRDWLLSASRDKTMRLWQLSPTPRVVKVFAGGHAGSILTHFVAEIPVEDASSRSPLGSYSGARSPPKSPSPRAAKTRLVAISGGGDGKICLWDIENGDGSPEKVVQAHTDSVFFLRGDSERIVSCSKDRTIRVFDIRTLEELVVIEDSSDGHRGAINAVDITKEFIVSASGDRTIKVWDIHDGRLRASLDAHVRGITSMAFEPHASRLAGWTPEVPGSTLRATLVTGSSDASIKTFHVVQLPPSAELDEVTFRDMLDLDADEPRVRYAIQPGVAYHAVCVCPVPTRPSPSGCMRCFNRGHTELVRSLYLGDHVTLSASYDKTIKMWERATGRLIFDFSGCHKGSVFAITGDHTRVVSSGIDAKIAIVDFAEGLDTSFV
ncbi:WD40 repeat-like protein [Cutaneotrichosporon oleaginosum]|uniref:WD40 repeat-like protein n=1 Tax=Cutaneotrichosporon oleaginosum TaxID=879819 RepID=A0A0J0XJT5_9TREE|nr:WD40 repeat-like protein [Cutaneotrichosporon oleaginosum]KLT41311.1 WD40 repeat-like protein [Cutaneotrichosporon oleaginosum]TXT14061.1 hypothetical protein COLE_00254 [Cutaneotrichosporon oleaginosum]